jgi:uncharacterized protein
VKLVLEEDESDALHRLLASSSAGLASSVVAGVEVPRAARRSAGRRGEARAQEVLRGIVLLELSNDVIERAVAAEPPALRSLDAIHLASALSLGADLGALVTYDDRMTTAAESAGLHVLAPA